ncbi:LysE family translocator [Defluviimonas sp. SAOS-178_SWC]|uniref:LysE family translocator n=1 Tax=Defluviimonas sp. SAOS-178_SWC TaxID=3121287 RepID=UPI0032221910
MTTAEIAALLIFLLPLAYSPGPGNLFFAASGARFGFGATLAANLGYHMATWVVTVMIGLGFAGILAAGGAVATTIRIAGSAYVFWLACSFLRAGLGAAAPMPRRAGFVGGSLLLILNPKAYVIIFLMFSQFLTGHLPTPSGVLAIATIFTMNNCLAFTLYTLAGDRIARSFRDPAHSRMLNIVFGLMLAAVASWMITA